MPRLIRLATRASPLAMAQARIAAAELRHLHPGLQVKLIPLVSGGDQDLTTPLYRMGTVGVFCREIHAAILNGKADAGVHSTKDLPLESPQGITLCSFLRREDPRDCLIGVQSLADLPQGALLGTSSPRRQAQLLAIRPDLRFTAIRGNLGTRLRKCAEGECQALVLAMAGLRRLNLRMPRCPLNPVSEMVPAPAQGIIGLDCRMDDHRTRFLLESICHRPSQTAAQMERAFLQSQGGGCSAPVGAYAIRKEGCWMLASSIQGERTCSRQFARLFGN